MRLGLPARVLLCVLVVLMLAGFGRGLAATMIAGRGDEYSSPLGMRYSEQYYERALALDPGNGAAIDMYTRTLYLEHNPESMTRGIRLSSAYLTVSRPSALYYRVLQRRANMEFSMDQFSSARVDFEQLAVSTKSAVAADMAAQAAVRLHDRDRARADFALTRSLDPRQAPSASELRRLGL